MKFISGGLFVAMAMAALYFFAVRSPSDVYAMPVDQAYDRLAEADLMPGGRSFYGRLDFSTRGNGRNSISWNGTTSHASRSCEIGLAPWDGDEGKTLVTVTCSGGGIGDGAASGMAHNLFRNAVIEKIDSTLEQRPYDERLARGATASGWPGDGVDGSLATARDRAIEMSQEAARMQSAFEEDQRAAAEQAEWDSFYDVEPVSGFED